MSDQTPLNPPDSPPAQPAIPEGLATKLGKLLIAAFGAIALVTAILDGDHTPETLMALGGTIATAITLMGGRYAQAAAVYRDAPSPSQLAAPASDVPTEEELRAAYQGDSPFAEPGDASGSYPVEDGPMPEGAVGDKPGAE